MAQVKVLDSLSENVICAIANFSMLTRVLLLLLVGEIMTNFTMMMVKNGSVKIICLKCCAARDEVSKNGYIADDFIIDMVYKTGDGDTVY